MRKAFKFIADFAGWLLIAAATYFIYTLKAFPAEEIQEIEFNKSRKACMPQFEVHCAIRNQTWERKS
jgi:hypothetical protein